MFAALGATAHPTQDSRALGPYSAEYSHHCPDDQLGRPFQIQIPAPEVSGASPLPFDDDLRRVIDNNDAVRVKSRQVVINESLIDAEERSEARDMAYYRLMTMA
jgi:hypothetical protein